MKKKSKLLIAIGIVLFLIISAITGVVIYIKSSLKPTKEFLNGEICGNYNTPCEVTPFVVDEGAYGSTTLEKLQAEGIIKDANIVYYWNRLIGGYSFYAGYYEIPNKINGQDIYLEQLLGYLSDPKNAHQDTVIVKLDEGDFVRSFAQDIAKAVTLKENPNGNEYDKTITLLNYWNDEDTIRGYMDEYPFLTSEMFNANYKYLLEGYLFPDTYEFFEFTTCDEIIRKIFDRTLSIFEDYEEEFSKSKLTTHEVFTLASIVQWESGDVDDSKKVAGVFLNRMENPEFEGTGGRFQSTVTACYALDFSKAECDAAGDLSSSTETDDIYNTYIYPGFPPGPVCCPNEIAINAALNPDRENDYYFFVADFCNGGTVFSRTYAEQLRNQDKYMGCAN